MLDWHLERRALNLQHLSPSPLGKGWDGGTTPAWSPHPQPLPNGEGEDSNLAQSTIIVHEFVTPRKGIRGDGGRGQHRRRLFWAFAIALVALVPSPAFAGPPFLTDDPEPTETGHWEVYGPYVEAGGRGADYGGSTGVELNFGAAKDLQLTAGLPVAFAHDATGGTWGAGDLELSAKYRFYHNEAAGVQIAAFPGISIPTASNGLGAGRVTALLPVWAQKDFGKWSLFGGGGFAINPGPGNRNFWTGGAVLTRQVSQRLMIGIEANRQGADTVGGNGSTALGLGIIWQLKAPFRLLASGGPTIEDNQGGTGFHMFAALGVDF